LWIICNWYLITQGLLLVNILWLTGDFARDII
jgi:hypothetical protein